MVRCSLNHVAVDVTDLEAAIEFYCGVFDMEQVPTPTFDRPYTWLQFGDEQLHIIERDTTPPDLQHFALIVDDFETVYSRAHDRGAIGGDTGYIRALPNGVVQCYIRDPAGNRIEFMWPDVDTLSEDITNQIDFVTVPSPTDQPAGATIAPNVYKYQQP